MFQRYRKHRPTIEKANSQSSYGSGGSSSDGGAAIGTEAAAQQCIEWNAKEFNYPTNGFFSRIEHTLLYAMLRSPNIFPADVVIKAIQEEDNDNDNNDDDWMTYLYARPERGQTSTTTTTTTSNKDGISYAQFSATLALAGESWDPKSSVPEILYKRILKCIIRYADENELNRKVEIDELLHPIQNRAIRGEKHASLAIILQLYIGWTASIITVNPIPLAVAYATMNLTAVKLTDDHYKEKHNLYQMKCLGDRTSNMEQTGLLNEQERELM